MNILDGVHIAGISNAFYLPVFLFLIFIAIYNYRLTLNFAKAAIFHSRRKHLLPGFSRVKQAFKLIFWSLGVAFLFLSLMRFQWGKVEENIPQEGRDLLVLLDISKSMRAEDLKPSRLDFVKLKIKSLLEQFDCERVGLILFSGSAFLQCPMTHDYGAFSIFLDQVDVETIASGTTAIDSALLRAISVFEDADDRKNKIVLLATDGEDFSLDLERVKAKARSSGVTIVTYGVGSTGGAPIPTFNQFGQKTGHEKENDGNIAISKLDEEKLNSLAKDVGGLYVRYSYGDEDIETITSYVRRFEQEKYDDKKTSFYDEKYPWFTGAAFVCLALEWIL